MFALFTARLKIKMKCIRTKWMTEEKKENDESIHYTESEYTPIGERLYGVNHVDKCDSIMSIVWNTPPNAATQM